MKLYKTNLQNDMKCIHITAMNFLDHKTYSLNKLKLIMPKLTAMQFHIWTKNEYGFNKAFWAKISAYKNRTLPL